MKSVSGGAFRQTLSSSRPSTRIEPAATRTACAASRPLSCCANTAEGNARTRMRTALRRKLTLQLRDEPIELRRDRAHRVGLTQIHSGPREQVHRIVAAAGAQQRQV